jgi:hypothetical protein
MVHDEPARRRPGVGVNDIWYEIPQLNIYYILELAVV